MKTTNSLTSPAKQKQTFSMAVTGDSLQNLIRKSVATPDAAARLTGALISSVAASPQLQQCVPASIVAAALRGEGQGLSIGREYHLVPFGQNCAYVIGYRGLIALALATGDVADMDCIEVRDGEYIGRDKRTKRPKFDFSIYATDEEAEQHPIIGYYCYIEKMNGYFRAEYMRVGEILDHAERYSKTFDRAKYDAICNGLGDYTPEEIEKIKSSSPWYSAPETMMKKTVIRKLLNSGYVRLANSAALDRALREDNASEDGLIPNLEIPSPNVVETTGENVEEAPESPQEPTSEAPTTDTQKEKTAHRQRKSTPETKTEKSAEPEREDEIGNFFFEG